MPSKSEKERRKQILNNLGQVARENFRAGLPMSKERFQELFDFLDERLTDEACDHSMRFTEMFLKTNNEDIEKVKSWLNHFGGYCDCEVANVEDHFENI